MRRNPDEANTIVPVGLGIGGTTAIFTLIHAIMLRSLPVSDPARLYRIGDGSNCCVQGGPQDRWGMFSFPLFERLKAEGQLDTPATASGAVRKEVRTLIAESFDVHVPKGYFYFSMAFNLADFIEHTVDAVLVCQREFLAPPNPLHPPIDNLLRLIQRQKRSLLLIIPFDQRPRTTNRQHLRRQPLLKRIQRRPQQIHIRLESLENLSQMTVGRRCR